MFRRRRRILLGCVRFLEMAEFAYLCGSMDRLKPLFVIPARGGSKGIPKKNIKLLHGKPLLHYAVECALSLVSAERVVLSTDSEEIAGSGRAAGLTVDYMRPAELATDTAGSREVIIDAMNWADSRGIDYDCVVLLQPTSPFRTVADIKACLEAYAECRPDIDMAVTVTSSAANPYYDCFETDDAGYLQVCKGPGTFTRRQDAPRVWQFNGAVYVFNPQSIRNTPIGSMRRRVAVEMPRERSLDLDTPLDWTIAEAIMNNEDGRL